MGKKRLEWLKRGICIAMAGAVLFSSDAMAYAAAGQPKQAVEAADILTGIPAEDTEMVGDTELPEGTQNAENVELPEDTETAGDTEVPKDTEVSESMENDGDTQTPEDTTGISETEEVEPTEVQEPEGVGSTELTESTEAAESQDTEEAAETAENHIKGAGAITGISINANPKYREMSIGEVMELPGYTVSYQDDSQQGEEPETEWVCNDTEIAALDTVQDKVTAKNPGVAYLRLQLKDDETKYDEYRVIVKPESVAGASGEADSYHSAQLRWNEVPTADGYTIARKEGNAGAETVLAHVNGAQTTVYQDDTLKTGVKYTYYIYAYIAYQDEKNQTQYAESDTPARIMITAELGKVTAKGVTTDRYNSLTVSWNRLDGADGYVILRASGASAAYKELTSVAGSTLTYTDQSVTAGITYKYKIKGYRMTDGARVYGDESNVVSGKAYPAAAELKASVSYNKVKLTWNKVAGASGYRIERKTAGASSYKAIETLGKGSSISYTDKTVKAGTKYTYRVRAYTKADGETVWGGYSNEKTVMPTMAATTVTLKNTSYNSITISWKKVSGAQGYKVLRASSASGSYKTVKAIRNADTLTFTDERLSVGTTYYYKVCAYRSVGGKNVNGKKSEVTSLQAVPTAVELKSEAAGATAVKLTWSKAKLPSSGGGYYIYQVVGGQEKKIKTCKKSATSYTVKGLTAGEKYTFKVAPYAKTKSGKAVRGVVSDALSVYPKLLPVTIDEVKAGSYNSVEVSWQATGTGDEDAYVVYRAASKKGSYKQIGTVAYRSGVKDYSYKDKTVTLGKKYFYKVLCTKTTANGKTMKSAYSGVKSVTAAPGTTTITVSSSKAESLKISWKRVKASSSKYVSGYAIYRSTSKNGTYKKIKTITNGKTASYIDSGLVTGNTYYYKVRAFQKSGGKTIYGAYSSVKSKQVVPAKPTIQAVSANYNTVTVSWKKVEGSSGYKIYRATQENSTYKAVKTITSANTLSYKNTKLTTGQTYYYKVRAYVNKGGKKIYGDYSKVKRATPVLGKPTGLRASATDSNQIKLTWNKVAGAETYTVLRSTAQNGPYKIATEICDTNSYLDTSVKTGTTYYYKVFAVRGNVVSETTDCVTAVASTLELSVSSVTIKTGSSVKVTATVKPSGFVSWTSDNPAVAVVSSDGTIYGMKAGTTTVRATANGITKQVAVTVKNKLGTENKGVDISSDNGNVDFNAIKAAGYEYVMLRISKGTTEDKNFDKNFKNAKAAGLKVGVYCYSLAQNTVDAKNEGDKVLEILGGQKLDYPVVYVMEDIALLYNSLTKEQRNELVYAFKYEIIEAGKQYAFALGISQELLTKYQYLDTSKFTGLDIWVINYRAESLGGGYQGKGNVAMWRYTNQGTVSGVSGKVNISIRYKTY